MLEYDCKNTSDCKKNNDKYDDRYDDCHGIKNKTNDFISDRFSKNVDVRPNYTNSSNIFQIQNPEREKGDKIYSEEKQYLASKKTQSNITFGKDKSDDLSRIEINKKNKMEELKGFNPKWTENMSNPSEAKNKFLYGTDYVD